MSDNPSSASGGIGFVGSWWWVLSPIWITAIVVCVFLLTVFCVGIGMVVRHNRKLK